MFLDVKGCTGLLFEGVRTYGKSPCFFGMGFLVVVSPAYGHYIVVNVDGACGT